MAYIEIALLLLLIICAIATCVSRNLIVTLIIFTSYSVIMSIIWGFLEAPDLAITEAAVGAGISSILLFLTLKKLRDMNVVEEEKAKALGGATMDQDGEEAADE